MNQVLCLIFLMFFIIVKNKKAPVVHCVQWYASKTSFLAFHPQNLGSNLNLLVLWLTKLGSHCLFLIYS